LASAVDSLPDQLGQEALPTNSRVGTNTGDAVEIQQLSTFIVASIILMFIPGVDMALVTRQVVVYGRRPAFATLAGLLFGGLTHAALATIGLSAILLTSATAYTVVKTAGAAYLIGLGVQTLWASRRRRTPKSDGQHASSFSARRDVSWRQAFTLGFLSDVTNPKVAIFFLTFLPQFVAPGKGSAAEIAFLGVLFNVIATTWWIGYVLIVDRAAQWLRRPTIRRIIERVTGAALIALGLRVAFERR
jgi:threonine/homoserine/homoserine lactone efflux protein